MNKNGIRERFLVHRLVLSEFEEYRPYPEYEVNHKDLNTSNNKLDNLEWVTALENTRHSMGNNKERIESMKRSGVLVGKKIWTS